MNAEWAHERAHDLAKQLGAYKLEATRLFASQAALEKTESRIMDAIGDLGERIDRFLSPKSGSGA